MTDPIRGLDELKHRLREFTDERDWDQFHSPKNLAMALAGEAGELLEHFQWLTEPDSRDLSGAKRQEVAMELADILIYLVRLSDKLDIDLIDACTRKIELNQERYPAGTVRGSSKKYNEYK